MVSAPAERRPPYAGSPQQQTAPTQPPATEEPSPTPVPVQEGVTKITFWHSMGGDIGGKAIPQMANDFNVSQGKCYVVYTYQGTYDDSLNKLKAGLQSGDTPSVIQLFDIATRLMVDLKVATPVQDYIDKENYDVSDLEPNVLAYYTVDGKQYSMPFNSSTPMLYYNKDMFRAAGLDPEKPPRTFDEFAEAARALTIKDSSGRPPSTAARSRSTAGSSNSIWLFPADSTPITKTAARSGDQGDLQQPRRV